MRLADKVAIITGAGSGIGRASASLFAEEGAKIVVADIDHEGGDETVASINAAGGDSIFVHTDVTIIPDLERMVKKTIDRFGKIDILFNNAGYFGKMASIEDTDEAFWDKLFFTNVKSMFFATKCIIPEIEKNGGGSILNMGSVGAIRPVPHTAAYVASKGAVITLTKALAIELAPLKIRVNCINPAVTQTPMADLFTDEAKAAIASSIPLGRLANPEDIALSAVYLASDESSMLTGSAIIVDGGGTI